MATRRNRTLPESNRLKRLQWYLVVLLVAGGAGMLVLGAIGYLTGLPDPVPSGPP